MSTTTVLNKGDLLDHKIKNYSELLALTEEANGYIREAEKYNKAKKLAWAKFFAVRKRVKSLKMNMGLPIEPEVEPKTLNFDNL